MIGKQSKAISLVGMVLAGLASVSGCKAKPSVPIEQKLSPLGSYVLNVSKSRLYGVDKNHAERSCEIILDDKSTGDRLLCDDDNDDGAVDNIICNYEPGGKWKWIIRGDSPELKAKAMSEHPKLYELANQLMREFRATNLVESAYPSR
ncbi:MAG: hypothetical protein Q7K43_01755 [Candidatus Woesearchaeota archaeon]|nr:hypothetical protein [Candidatus Woesearchaeota archaeon]